MTSLVLDFPEINNCVYLLITDSFKYIESIAVLLKFREIRVPAALSGEMHSGMPPPSIMVVNHFKMHSK